MKVSGVRPVNPPDNLQLLPDDEPAEVLDVVGAAVAGVPSRALLVTHLYSRYIVQQSDVLTLFAQCTPVLLKSFVCSTTTFAHLFA